jgi:tetratricopeptide (TPR) repeat protein
MTYILCELDYLIVGVDISRGKLEKLIKKMDGVCDDKRQFEAYLTKGICLQKLGRYAESKGCIKKALKIASASPVGRYAEKHIAAAYIRMGNVYDEKKKYTKAFMNYREGMKKDRSYIYGNCMIGLLYSHKGYYRKARKIFTDIINNTTEDKERIFAYRLRGQSYYKQENYTKAINDYKKIIEINPRVSEAYYNMGNAFAAKKEFNNALNNYVISSYYNAEDDTNENIKIQDKIDVFDDWHKYKDKIGAFPYCFYDSINCLNDYLKKKGANIGNDILEYYKCLLGALYPLWYLSFVGIPESNEDDQYIYHYGDVEYLGKILETRSLKLIPAGYQNDPKEGKAFFEKLFDYMPSYDTDKKLRDCLKRIMEKSIDDNITYIYCFSKNVDYIPMWNSSYGHDGKGYALCIDKAKINKTPLANRDKKVGKTGNENMAQLYKVVYVNANKYPSGRPHPNMEDKFAVNFLLKNIAGCLKNIVENILNLEYTDKEAIVTALSKLFCQIAHLFKYDDWEIEGEYRLVHTDKLPAEKHHVRSDDINKGIYVKTKAILFEKNDKLKNDKILLGPKVDDLKYLKIKHFVKEDEKKAVEIERSKVQYR